MMNSLAPPESPMDSGQPENNFTRPTTTTEKKKKRRANDSRIEEMSINGKDSNFEDENEDMSDNGTDASPGSEKESIHVTGGKNDGRKFDSSSSARNRNALVSIFEINSTGSLGIKTMVMDDGEMMIASVSSGLQAHKMGIREGDYIVAAELTGLKGATYSTSWKEAMSPHILYRILMSRHRPLHIKIRRRGDAMDDNDEDSTEPDTKRRRWTKDDDACNINKGGALVQKKRGRPAVGNKATRVDVEYRVQKEVDELRQWREGITRATEIKQAADEIELYNFGFTTNEVSNPALGTLAVQSLKDHIASLRAEADKLWNNPNHTWWENNLKAYLEFKQEFGHGKITKEMRSKGDLHDWASRMRDKYRNPSKGEAKTLRNRLIRNAEHDILKKVGFDFESFNGNWDYMFHRMLEYKEKHGTFVPPRKNAKEDKETQRLADWVVHQRSKYREKHDPDRPNRTGILTDEQERRLTEVGFVFMEKVQWDDHYEALKKWIAENGHARIPKVYPQNQPLSSFVHTNRRYRMWQLEGKERAKKAWRRLTPERIQMLDDIGFIWDTNGTSLITRKTPRLRKVRGDTTEQDRVHGEEHNISEQQAPLGDAIAAYQSIPPQDQNAAQMHLEQMPPTEASYQQQAETVHGEVPPLETQQTVGLPPMNENYFLYGRER